MRSIIVILCFAIMSLSVSGQEKPMTHSELATDILIYLAATEACLRSCKDEESIKAAIPQLQRLKVESDRLMAIQRSLPDPTRQDSIDVEQKGVPFIKLWKAIRNHIERLETDKLMTQEMRDILYIAPPAPEKGTQSGKQ